MYVIHTMKINLENISQAEEPLHLFYSGCKTDTTRAKTLHLWKKYSEFIEDLLTEKDFEARANELVYKARQTTNG